MEKQRPGETMHMNKAVYCIQTSQLFAVNTSQHGKQRQHINTINYFPACAREKVLLQSYIIQQSCSEAPTKGTNSISTSSEQPASLILEKDLLPEPKQETNQNPNVFVNVQSEFLSN